MKESHLHFNIFQVPEADSWPKPLAGNGKAGLLVLLPETETLAEDKNFLTSILEAAQLTPLEEEIFLLSCSTEANMALAQLCRANQIHTVIIFGYPLSSLGIRANLPWYQFIRIGELTLLNAHTLQTIRTERAQNKNEKAGALWKAIKTKFL